MQFIYHLVFPIVFVIASFYMTTAQETTTITQPCPDISPCTYVDPIHCNGNVNVECRGVSMEEVKTAFNSLTSPIVMRQITLYIQPSGDTISADVLGRSLVTSSLIIVGNTNFPSLRVHPDAFRATKLTVYLVELQFLDVSQLDFQFLANSYQVYYLSLLQLLNLHQSLPTLPALTSLGTMLIYDSTDLNQNWQNGNVFLPIELDTFIVINCGLDDEGVGRLLDWIKPNSAETLYSLQINYNRISSIPRQITSFRGLESIIIKSSAADLTVQTNSFNGSINQKIDLTESRLVRVEPDAFLGNYNSTNVYLSKNLLTRFEERVFKSMLQDMPGYIDGSYRGLLDVVLNPFDCYSDPCHLAWLLRDNRNLLKGFYNPPQCANGTAFEDLSPSLFQNCP